MRTLMLQGMEEILRLDLWRMSLSRISPDLPAEHSVLEAFQTFKFLPGGLPHGGRYARHDLLLCKAESGYRTLTKANITYWGLVHDSMDMLSACAVRPQKASWVL
jgi:hypothetical protein